MPKNNKRKFKRELLDISDPKVVLKETAKSALGAGFVGGTFGLITGRPTAGILVAGSLVGSAAGIAARKLFRKRKKKLKRSRK